MTTTIYERFPARIVLLSNGVALTIYVLGFSLLAQLHVSLAVLYLLYCLWAEYNLLRKSCVDCYYYGKICAFGKGRICSLLFPRGNPSRFAHREISWRQVLPDMLVLGLPLVGGIFLLIFDFTWISLLVLSGLILFSMLGNAIVRGQFACRHCKQRIIGCPAYELFSQKNG